MTEEIKTIREEARRMGACNLADKVHDWQSLARILLSAQGLEFVQKNQGDELMALFRAHGAAVADYGIMVDAGQVEVTKTRRAAFVGETSATVEAEGTEKAYVLAAIGGARLTVKASGYAVIRLYNIGGEVSIENDGTAIILK